MKLCVLGASGNSGRALVHMALDRGHEVTAVVRNKAKIADLDRAGLSVSDVSLADPAGLREALRGHDAVINAAGYVSDGPAFVDLVKSVIRAADAGLGPGGRFWLFGGAGLLDVPGTNICTLDLPGVPKIYEAHRTNFEAVRATQLDWSMICPGPMMAAPDGKPTEDLIVSRDAWPTSRPFHTRVLPRIALSLAFKQAIPRMTIYYEDAAKIILDNLVRAGPLAHGRVGVALPARTKRFKPAS